MPRTSGGLFLEVLTARPQAGVPLEVTVWDGANPANMLAQLQGASGVTFQHVLSDVGSGSFRIAVDDPKATTANIREGNLAKVRLNDVDTFPFWLESPKLVVSESGKSEWQLGGSGALQVLSQAVAYPPGWPTPTGTDRVWTAATAGLILKTLVDEAQARGALAHVTYDFTAAVDSQSNPWPADLELTTHAGTSVLDVAKQLAALGITILMTPQLVFRAFVSGTYGRDLSTSVVWRYGRHVAGDVTRVGIRSVLQDAVLVEGSGGKFVEINDPATIADPYTGRREGGLSFTSSADPTTLQNAGNAQIAITKADANAITVPLNHGTAPGLFTPYADYQPGDWVSLDVPGQYAMARLQVKALTLSQTEGGDYTVAADLNAVAIDYLVRLKNALSSKAGTASSASGSVSGSLGYGAPPPSGTPLTANTPAASAPGDTGAVGAGTAAARDDHRHGREAWGLAGDIGTEAFSSAAAAGSSGRVADAGHVHPMPAAPSVPAASGTVTGETSFGQAPAAGAATAYSRGDHTHGTPAAPSVPSAASTVTGPDAFGASPAVGTSASYARADHDHGLPAASGGMANPMTALDDLIVGGTVTGGVAAPARLAKGSDGQVLTVDPTTHHLVWATPSASAGVSSIAKSGSTPLTGAVTLTGGTNVTLTQAGNDVSIAAAAGGGGGSFSTLTGWTTLGSLDTSNVTDVPGYAHIANASIGYAVNGLYKAVPAFPFTVTVQVLDSLQNNNYVQVGLLLTDATPTKLVTFGWLYGGYGGSVNDLDFCGWTSRTSRSSSADANINNPFSPNGPGWLRLVVHSSTNIDALYSFGGKFYTTRLTVQNPGFTVANYGICLAGNTAGGAVEGLFDLPVVT